MWREWFIGNLQRENHTDKHWNPEYRNGSESHTLAQLFTDPALISPWEKRISRVTRTGSR